ncbi:hypothetical protein SEVIR_5G101650v4 [Setaria viridis]
MTFPWILARIQPGPPAPFLGLEEKGRNGNAVAGCDPQRTCGTRNPLTPRTPVASSSLGPPYLSSPFSSSSPSGLPLSLPVAGESSGGDAAAPAGELLPGETRGFRKVLPPPRVVPIRLA